MTDMEHFKRKKVQRVGKMLLFGLFCFSKFLKTLGFFFSFVNVLSAIGIFIHSANPTFI